MTAQNMSALLPLLQKQIVCIAGLGTSCGKSLMAVNLSHLLEQEGIQAALVHTRLGVLRASDPQAAARVALIEVENENYAWYEMAHEILLVADPFRLNGTMICEAHRFLEGINKLGRPVLVRLIINRAQDGHDAKRVYDLLRKEVLDFSFIHLKYFGYLPLDPLLKTWGPQKKAFVEAYPHGMTAAFFRSLALRIKYNYELWRH